MTTSTIIAITISLVLAALCGGAALILFLFFVIGLILLRRRGKKNVTAKEAVKAGAERVSQVFMRTERGLQAVDDDDDDGDSRPIG